MQSVTYTNHNQQKSVTLKMKNQYLPRRRDGMQCQKIYAAVLEWESTIPGKAQEIVAQLVAEQWEKQNGRGISVNKQNLYRYLKNESGSEKYTGYVIQLSTAIADAMPIEVARKYGLKRGLGTFNFAPVQRNMVMAMNRLLATVLTQKRSRGH